jgi:hypothetical protein
MNNKTITSTSLAKQLVIEFLNQNKNRSVKRMEIDDYVKRNWNGPKDDLTPGLLAGTLYNMSQAKKLKAIESGFYRRG